MNEISLQPRSDSSLHVIPADDAIVPFMVVGKLHDVTGQTSLELHVDTSTKLVYYYNTVNAQYFPMMDAEGHHYKYDRLTNVIRPKSSFVVTY